ncbi:MAG: DUF2505 domain-containing protein [Haloechinothrix sp.]
MASRIEHRAEFKHPLDQVLSAMSSKDALTEQLAEIGGHNAALLDHSTSATGVSYTLRQGVPADKLPGAVRGLHPGDLMVRREQTWERVEADRARGTAHAHVSGIPGDIRADTELIGNDDRTEWRVTGEVKVRIPLLGGKLERTISEQVTRLMVREGRFIAERLAQR